MPFGIRPSNVRVCHSTTRALWDQRQKLPQPDACGKYHLIFLLVLLLVIVIEV